MNRDQFYAGLLTPFLSALFGAILGTSGILLVSQYEKASSQQNLRVALTGEIEAILISVRLPALRTSWAWEGKGEPIRNYQIYYPRAIFDGNVAQLGSLRDTELLRKITQLYAGLEMVREEGRRLDTGVTDSDGAVRYAHFLFAAYLKSIELVQELTGDVPEVYPGTTVQDRQFNAEAITGDVKQINSATKALTKAAVYGSGAQVKKEGKSP